jgi:RNA polymerase sigma-70 factor (ECF subfamily)
MKTAITTRNITKSAQDDTNNVNGDILDQAITGDLEAFGLLYQENIQRIYNYIFYRTGNSADAEDLSARVFQRALKHIQSYEKTEVPFSAWLYRIAHNLVANWHRDNSRKNEVPLEDQENIFQRLDHPEISIVKDQQVELLLKVIHTLSSDRQLIIILKFVEDLSNMEIAQIMGKSEGAVKSLYHRTLLELRDLINKGNL